MLYYHQKLLVIHKIYLQPKQTANSKKPTAANSQQSTAKQKANSQAANNKTVKQQAASSQAAKQSVACTSAILQNPVQPTQMTMPAKNVSLTLMIYAQYV